MAQGNPDTTRNAEASDLHSRNHCRILIVDDTPANLLSLEAILQDLDAQLVFAKSAEDALRHLLKGDFALVVMDVQMPDMDGLEAAKLIRSRETTKSTPIIFATAFDERGDFARLAYALGAVDYVLKPINPDFFRAKVQVFVDLYNKTLKLTEQAAQLLEGERARQKERERNHALELVSAGIAHELNNPLMAVINLIQYALSETPEDSALRAPLAEAEEHTQRAIRIVRDLHSYSWRQDLTPRASQQADLNLAVSKGCRALRITLEEAEIVPELSLADGLGPVVMDAGNLEQIVINLVGNAIDAIGDGKDKHLRIQTRREGGFATLEVVDNGSGIAPSDLPRVFEPFFTTKPPGAGTGLGLALCRNLAESFGGSIELRTHENQGSTFKLLVLLAEGD